MIAIKQTVTVQHGGRVEVTSAELSEGQQGEVIILVSERRPARRLTDFIGAGQGLYSDSDDADRAVRSERDAWES
jgi:hypothetical protein